MPPTPGACALIKRFSNRRHWCSWSCKWNWRSALGLVSAFLRW